jgi:hypothetical protein
MLPWHSTKPSIGGTYVIAFGICRFFPINITSNYYHVDDLNLASRRPGTALIERHSKDKRVCAFNLVGLSLMLPWHSTKPSIGGTYVIAFGICRSFPINIAINLFFNNRLNT